MVKYPPAIAGDAGDTGLIPGLGRSPGEEIGNPLQNSCRLESMGSQRVGMTEGLSTHSMNLWYSTGNSTQYSIMTYT